MANRNALEERGVKISDALSLWGDMDSYEEGLKEFQESLSMKLNDLKSYLASNDWENYAILAHSMKSEAKYLGFLKDAEEFYLHEQKGKEKDSIYLIEHFPHLEQTILTILTTIQNYFETSLNQSKVHI